MLKYFFLILLIFIGFRSYNQTIKDQYVGLNVFQLPASTINFNYSKDYLPYITLTADIGYTFGYKEGYDLIGYFLTPHIKLYDGYTINKRTGGYVKFGSFLNIRESMEKSNFIHIGFFLTNSIVYEKGLYLSPTDSRPYSYAAEIEQNVYVIGFGSSLGYEFKLSDRLKSHLDFQLSFPSDKYLDLYGYSNFIPGMGYKDLNEKWFPLIILNLKYKL